jgi:orotate phosphoribosyltransferase
MSSFLDLARARRGHFHMESGLHCGLWFDLDAVFVDHAALDPFVTQLAQSLRRHDVEAVCGPLTGGAFLAQLLARLLGGEFYFTAPEPAGGQETFAARYRLPAGTGHRLLGKRVAIVDDVMSTASSLRATLTAVESHGAIPVVVGALYVLGTIGADFFRERGLRVETTGRAAFETWRPAECPLCASGIPLDDPANPAA